MSTEAVPVLGQVAESARFLNDTIAKGIQRLGGVEVPVDFFCECGDPGLSARDEADGQACSIPSSADPS